MANKWLKRAQDNWAATSSSGAPTDSASASAAAADSIWALAYL